MPGPPPKDATRRRRRQSTPGFRLLPHEGRGGEAPNWPLTVDPNPAELELWEKLWSLPQAVEWERMRAFDIVALYVRVFVEASFTGADTKLLAEVRQLDAKIGLSPKAMRDLRWETDEPEPELEEPEADAPPTPARAFVPKVTA